MRAGYFSVRGVPFRFGGHDVTDIDVWLYLRPSSLTRERILVDAKDKGKPKALERVLWVKGLQSITGVEGSIVATTDKRPAVRQFGEAHGVLVLDGTFLGRLPTVLPASAGGERLFEDELFQLLTEYDRLLGQWRVRLLEAKARLIEAMDFGGCNAWLTDTHYFANQTITSSRREAACRLTYLMISYFLIGLDYSIRRLVFEHLDERQRAVEDGFRYGRGGRADVERSVSIAAQLLDNYAPEAGGLAGQLRSRIAHDFRDIPADVLSEYFVRPEVSRELFGMARTFEAAAYAQTVVRPEQLEQHAQATLGVVLDFLRIERAQYYAALS
ncbi:MAG: hypothetical protein JNK64_26315 [Myxococcales bacterium]|nr:hypothetical protein [Myxococcales bacterium]